MSLGHHFVLESKEVLKMKIRKDVDIPKVQRNQPESVPSNQSWNHVSKNCGSLR